MRGLFMQDSHYNHPLRAVHKAIEQLAQFSVTKYDKKASFVRENVCCKRYAAFKTDDKTDIMKNKTALLVFLFLTLVNNNFAQQKKKKAPKATAAEAQLSFREIPKLKKGFINSSPSNRRDGVPVGKLGIDGGNKEMILKLAKEMANGKHGNFDSFLIAHKGKLIFESYYLKGRINLPHPQASATKVYTSMALGRAIQLGYLTMDDLDKPIASFLKDLNPAKFAKGAEKITLNQALTMRSGIRIKKEDREKFEKDPSQIKGQKEVQAYFEHTAPIASGTPDFLYQNDPMLVMQVIEAVVPGSAKDFIKKEVLNKLGITNYRWVTDPSGLPRAGSRSSMTSRDMVKWGTLAMNKGKWNGEQLIPEAFINKAIHRIVRESDDENFDDSGDISNVGYGYFWWQADMKVGNRNYFSTSAQGGSGQTIVLIEELDLIVVTTVHRLKISVLQLVAERVLPGFVVN
ncbi:serine hydrolase domain-containing protein [Pseudotenacibaculum haliotis]|uniref:Serine hydrolase domain-containing protein n=1 Tax=Pseudotenacibaculum haliotis TaxID=1862138 RepID=A0ABW5LU78_9FLAO